LSYLIDTNVLSELRKRQPDQVVVNWFAKRPGSSLYLSVLTIGELRKGILAMRRDDPRKTALLDWLEHELPRYFDGRILPIDMNVANRWGQICAIAKRPLPAIDSLIAATAMAHDLMLVTRNARDFNVSGIVVVDPWQDKNTEG
jgi:predicted nucleic acid-binding protein